MSSNAFEIPLVEGDSGPRLRFHLLDSDASAVSGDVSGVRFYFKRAQAQTHSNAGHEACSGFDVANGVWDYTLHPGDTSGAGTFYGDVEVSFGDGSVETAFEAVRFLVRANNKE